MTCQFKAVELLELRRAVAKDPTLPLLHIAIIIKLIDDARHTHQDLSGCKCWEEAITRVDRSVAA